VHSQTHHVFSRTVPKYVFGTWKIDRYDKRGGTATDPLLFVGKKISLSRSGVTCDNYFLSFDYPCKLHHYSFIDWRPGHGEVYPGFLYMTKDGFESRSKQLRIYYDDSGGYREFEVTTRNELMTYYDGWLFFLKKVRSTRN
jgi:hypothetical protein